jgi:hypothetical protein
LQQPKGLLPVYALTALAVAIIGGPFLTGTGTFIRPAYGTSIPSSADIKIGTILFADAASRPLTGRVLLTNQYQPNLLLSGDIQVTQTLQGRWGAIFMDGGAGNPSVAINSRGSITLKGTLNTSSSSGDGGAIALSAQNNITTSTLYSFTNGAGKGGNITLRSTGGSIDTSTGVLNSYSMSGNAGAITLTAQSDITTGTLYSFTNGAGKGGNITLSSTGGSIDTSTGVLNSYSMSGNAGAIALTSLGNITTAILNSEAGGTGNGGDITLTSNAGGIDTTKGAITSQIREGSNGTGRAGTIVFTAQNNIQTASLDASAEKGDGSSIQLTSSNGEIDTTKGTLYTESRNGNGGAIGLTAANGSITTGNLYSVSTASDGDAGQGGAINLTAANDINITGDLDSYSTASDGDAGQGGAINLTAANDINITGRLFSASQSQ